MPIVRQFASNLLLATFLSLPIVALSGPVFGQTIKTSDKRSWPSQSYPQQPIQARICSCLYAGQNVPIGQTICMKFDGKRVLAKCDTVVNSPSWSISKTACPET